MITQSDEGSEARKAPKKKQGDGKSFVPCVQNVGCGSRHEEGRWGALIGKISTQQLKLGVHTETPSHPSLSLVTYAFDAPRLASSEFPLSSFPKFTLFKARRMPP